MITIISANPKPHFDILSELYPKQKLFTGAEVKNGNGIVKHFVFTLVGWQQIKSPHKELEYIRQELRAERVSYNELLRLQTLSSFISDGDVELLEAAGIPEFEE